MVHFFVKRGKTMQDWKIGMEILNGGLFFLAILLLLKRLIPSTTSTPRDGLPECMGQGTWTLSMIARLLKTCTENTAKAWQKMKREPKAKSLMHSGWWGNISSSNIQAWNSLVSALRSLGTSISSTFWQPRQERCSTLKWVQLPTRTPAFLTFASRPSLPHSALTMKSSFENLGMKSPPKDNLSPKLRRSRFSSTI